MRWTGHVEHVGHVEGIINSYAVLIFQIFPPHTKFNIKLYIDNDSVSPTSEASMAATLELIWDEAPNLKTDNVIM
jgi:hypothetical protein